MSANRAVVFVLAAVLAAPVAAGAQSLAEIAKKEKERRKKAQGEAQTFTESDLGRSKARIGAESVSATPGEDAAPAEGGEGAAAAPAGAPQKSEEELRSEQQAQWQTRLKEARDTVGRLEAERERVQLALNDLTQPLYGSNRASLASRLEEVDKELVTARQSVSDLETEGRSNRFRE